jgi:hypothetical protein
MGGCNMAILARRFFSLGATAAILLLSAPVAFAQWGAAAKWIFEGIGAVAAGLGISQYIEKWLGCRRGSGGK